MFHHLQNIKPRYWLLIFVIIHFIAWTLAPALIRLNLPMDSIEGALWGQQLELGYDKNPFMNGWLTAFAVYISHHSDWMIYLFSQLSVAICFFAIWQLAKKMLPPIYALFSVLLLEALQYYSFHAIDFNDNTLELSIWALTTLFFYQALQEKNKIRYWLLTGIFAGLGMMTKYYIITLLLPMFALLLFNPNARQAFKSIGLYLGLAIAIAISLPHAIWLFSHDFVTLDYALHRVESTPNWFNHVFFPIQFLWQQFEVLLPALCFLLILFIGEKPLYLDPPLVMTRFNKQFLFFVGVGPLLLTALLSAFTGMTLRAGWGQPLFSLSGIILMAWLQPAITPEKFYRFIAIIFGFLFLTAIAYSFSLVHADSPSSANYPGKNIAASITMQWHEKYHTPLKYAAGVRWHAGNIAYYSIDHPTVWIEWNKRLSPWVDQKKLEQEGAVFIWDADVNQSPSPADIKKQFPSMTKPERYAFAWLRNKNTPPIHLLIAFLPPAIAIN